MIERLLGGFADSARVTPHRSLTQIEQGLALQIIERAAAVLADTWSRACPLTVREEGMFSDPAQLRIMPGDELVSVATFHIAFDGHAGRMSLCVPAPITDLLVAPTLSGDAPVASTQIVEPDAQDLMEQAVELRAILAQTKLRLSEVLALQEGDLITTDVPIHSPIPLRLHDQTIRSGRIAQLNGRRVIEISDPPPVSPSEGPTPS
jgi:flagellar motor switch protein FliM